MVEDISSLPPSQSKGSHCNEVALHTIGLQETTQLVNAGHRMVQQTIQLVNSGHRMVQQTIQLVNGGHRMVRCN